MKKIDPPAFLQPVDATRMRQINRSVILELIRQNSPIARSEISRALGLSMPTVMRIVKELISGDLVRYTGETAGGTGRPRELLEYNKDGYAVIGIDLGGTKLYGALANIGGEILGETRLDQHNASDEEGFELVSTLIQSLIDLARKNGQQLLGIAVGAPGITHSYSGIVEWAPTMNWRNFPLKSRLQERFQYPIVVENDVNMHALGEQWFGVGKGVNNMVLIAIGTGMGAGLIIDGAIYRGQNESAGEPGYMLPSPDALGQRYDQFGAMENIVSGKGITERARAALANRLSPDALAALTAAEVFDAARHGEDWAKKIVDETVDYLSIVIANTATLLDPELIVLGGGVSKSADLLVQPILKRIEGVIQHIPRIEVSRLGPKATVMGAITLIVHTTKDYYVVRRLY
ncbi:MAG: ROK family transcriptional regulator [Chloroflexota bacterium]